MGICGYCGFDIVEQKTFEEEYVWVHWPTYLRECPPYSRTFAQPERSQSRLL